MFRDIQHGQTYEPRMLRAFTIFRSWQDPSTMRATIRETGSVVTHLSVMGTTIVKGR